VLVYLLRQKEEEKSVLMTTAFLITAFDQLREVRFTVHMFRNLWKTTKESPVVVVISGDKDRDLDFPDDPYTRVVHIDDMVGEKFKTKVSTSIMRQIEHGMLEVKDLEREHGQIDEIVHMHGDILLLGEDGFRSELAKWRESCLPVAADNVGAQSAITKELFGTNWTWAFFGTELMPQLFVVDHHWCKFTGFMYNMEAIGMAEKKATEWALIGNLHRAAHEHGSGQALMPQIDPHGTVSPYQPTFNDLVHVVKKNRPQWGLHHHWGGFCHFGNSLHYTKEHRESRNEQAMRKYGIDLEGWNVAG
jgi:hypothetical protein